MSCWWLQLQSWLVLSSMPPASRAADGEAAPVFVTKIIPRYRDWRFISVAHEEGELNDIRVILGNDTAIRAYRETRFPFRSGRSLPELPGNMFRRRKTTRSSAVPNPLFPETLQSGISSSWSRTPKNTLQRADGGLNLIKTANLPMKRRSKPASLATKKSKVATLSLLATRRNAERETWS